LRWSFGLLLAAIVAVLTVAVVVQATQTFSTPNVTTLAYNLAANTSSAAITPPASMPVLVMGVDNTINARGVGFITMLRVPATFLQWVGLNSPSAVATSGHSNVAGTHIVYLDLGDKVDLRVNTADTFIVHNANTTTQSVQVKLIW
jgi:hypothetical protein